MRKRSLTKTLWKRAFRKTEKAMIAAVKRRDMNCRLCGSTTILQVDHVVISRRHLSCFFEIKQTLLLCKSHHFQKTYRANGVDIKVLNIIRRREGDFFIHAMVDKSHLIKKYSVQELEDLERYFNGLFL